MTDLAVRRTMVPGAEKSQPAAAEHLIRVQLDVDAELLLEAQRQIGAETLDVAVNEALRRLVDEERGKRAAARAKLRQMYDDGEFSFDEDDER